MRLLDPWNWNNECLLAVMWVLGTDPLKWIELRLSGGAQVPSSSDPSCQSPIRVLTQNCIVETEAESEFCFFILCTYFFM